MSDIVTEIPLNRQVSWKGLEHEVTPLSEFFCRKHNQFPEPPETLDWAGHVLSPRELAQMPQVEHVVTLECAGNGRTEFSPVPSGTPWGNRGMSTGHFRGVAVSTLLDRFPPSSSCRHVIFQGADCGAEGFYERSLSFADIEKHQALLALEMNGQPLTLAHGAPVRLVVPGYYAMASIKWLTSAQYSVNPSSGYYQVEDYLVKFPDSSLPVRPATTVRPKSFLISPRQGETVSGSVTIEGKAWSGEGAVSGVSLWVSGASETQKLEAVLGPSLGPYAWRGFSATLTLLPGTYSLRSFCRAGEQIQPEQAPWNVQGYENNSAPRVDFQVL
jgi:DMSO/TMAO reductase YedYZ molybdopterin-dependent catalytic subunit